MDSSNSISQYVSSVLSFTSQYSDVQWRALNLVGQPTSNAVYGDNSNAWCPATSNENQILELLFEIPVYINQIKIYENYNGGAITKIEAFNSSINSYEAIWSREAPVLTQFYNIFSPEFPSTTFQSNQVRLTISQSERNLFAEIEAVELVGRMINLEIPNKSLTDDIFKLFNNSLYSDIELSLYDKNTNSFVEAIKCHRNILAIRSKTLFDYIESNSYHLRDVNHLESKILVEFIYSDQLNENIVKKIIEEEKSKIQLPSLSELTLEEEVVEDNHELDTESAEEKWFLCVNNLIRLTIRFGLERLEKLLLNYMIKNFIDLNNVLNILVDSLDGCDFNESTDLKAKFHLPKLEEICLSFIKVHIKKIIKLEKFTRLPKDVLIKIVRTL